MFQSLQIINVQKWAKLYSLLGFSSLDLHDTSLVYNRANHGANVARCLIVFFKAIFEQSNSAEGRALVNPIIFPYRVIKCVTVAKN
jgi:hypothetical protein